MNQLLETANSQDKALNNLIRLCKDDENVSYVINKYSVTDKKLKDLYYILTTNGAEQYARGHLVAASSLACAYTLKFLLDHFDGEYFTINNKDKYNSSLFISDRLTQYFEKSEHGEILSYKLLRK